MLIEGEPLLLHSLPGFVAQMKRDALTLHLSLPADIVAADDEEVEKIIPAIAARHRAEIGRAWRCSGERPSGRAPIRAAFSPVSGSTWIS